MLTHLRMQDEITAMVIRAGDIYGINMEDNYLLTYITSHPVCAQIAFKNNYSFFTIGHALQRSIEDYNNNSGSTIIKVIVNAKDSVILFAVDDKRFCDNKDAGFMAVDRLENPLVDEFLTHHNNVMAEVNNIINPAYRQSTTTFIDGVWLVSFINFIAMMEYLNLFTSSFKQNEFIVNTAVNFQDRVVRITMAKVF
jgi:hypothetical protein